MKGSENCFVLSQDNIVPSNERTVRYNNEIETLDAKTGILLNSLQSEMVDKNLYLVDGVGEGEEAALSSWLRVSTVSWPRSVSNKLGKARYTTCTQKISKTSARAANPIKNAVAKV